ncbi:2-hydroxyacid dehydrogenase [Aureibaculum conchae]|uniref:2-hydroxyacid dehydrogenase n=1 Tax=Aureibaculum sp. 2308TA14-22 TaxID=3108392 RepID=UPI003391D2AB
MLNILHLEKDCYSQRTLQKIEEVGLVNYLNTESQVEFINHLENNKYDVIFAKLGLAINKQVIDLLPSLKCIVTPTTGLNHIDLKTAEKNNIAVISLKGEVEILKEVRSTAEHTWMLLLSLIRNLPSALEDVKQGGWQRKPFLADELDGKTIGIIGFGRLGKIIASYALPFNMKVLATDTDKMAFNDKPVHIKEVGLKQLLIESDIVSLHIPSNETNKNFLDSDKFELMKQGTVLINTARGEVIDEKALLSSLKNNKIKAAAVDVLDDDSIWEEKSPKNHALIQYAQQNSNLIITPHMGGYGQVSIEKTRDFITDKFINNI